MSDESGFEPLVDDGGQVYGYVGTAEDGAIVGLDENGTIVSAFTPDGTEIDAEDYQLVGPEDDVYADDGMAALDARLDELEERVANPVQPYTYELQYDQLDRARLTSDMLEQARHIEAAIDRPLTRDEKRAIAEEALVDVEAGQSRPDLVAAMHRLEERGEPIADLDTGHRGIDHQRRTDLMATRLSEIEADQRGDEPGSIAPPTQPVYDLDDPGERVNYMVDRLRGADTDPGDTYASSDYAEGGDDFA